ncbi:MAG: vanadium-dependent haloperoxidase [Devosia nanyangense]|uniref:Vanadium-dependent haloperoxidase n=1 Tax=Devosia nanyangense TaxID=1228055 RepID=A0A933L201_9HYPH|nr:vanadium-dependent haloperoxidase [Devosia nanyangense]
MKPIRRLTAAIAVAVLAGFGPLAAHAAAPPEEVLTAWYKMALSLTRHTATYTPPVASRAYAYLGVTAFEAVASGSSRLQTLSGQLNGLTAGPQREAGQTYDEAVVLDTALAATVHSLFENTGPTGHRAMDALEAKLHAEAAGGLAADVVTRSEAYGQAIAAHILDWSKGDGGAVVENMGFPAEYALTSGPAHWVPTSAIVQQQFPLLPGWGTNRTFAMPTGATCPLPAPLDYSEDPASEFYTQALETYETKNNLSPEQRAIARFWADDAMLSVTPPGHWLSIGMQIIDRDRIGLEKSVDILARLGIAEADAFIGCWNAKFVYDLVRPVTYIRRLIDPKWESLLITPPFPEYPSGHSTQSGAAATVLTSLLGDDFAFDDATDEADGLKPRSFASFWAAANEAGISRLYGGIHFRAAIERGLDQGRCIGAYTIALRTWR